MRLVRHIRRSRLGAVAVPASPNPALPQTPFESDLLPIELELADRTVFARVARHHAQLQPGVAGFDGAFHEWLRGASGISVRIVRGGALDITVRIHAEYGTAVLDLGRRVQEAVACAVRRLSDRPIQRINVQITHILGAETAPQRENQERRAQAPSRGVVS